MKLKNLFSLLILSLFFVACDSNNNSNKPMNTAQMMEGTYKGTVMMSVMGKDMPQNEANVEIKANTNGTITIVLPGQIGDTHAMKMPSITVPNIKVSAKDGMYMIEETKIDQSIKDKKYVGMISGTVKDKMLDLKYSIKPGAMPMSINFTFTGKK